MVRNRSVLMSYTNFLSSISKNDKFRVIQEKYDKYFFGSYQIILLFRNSLNLEILNDRGIIEIFILYGKRQNSTLVRYKLI